MVIACIVRISHNINPQTVILILILGSDMYLYEHMVSRGGANLPPALDRASIIFVLAPGVTFETSKARESEFRGAIRAIC